MGGIIPGFIIHTPEAAPPEESAFLIQDFFVPESDGVALQNHTPDVGDPWFQHVSAQPRDIVIYDRDGLRFDIDASGGVSAMTYAKGALAGDSGTTSSFTYTLNSTTMTPDQTIKFKISHETHTSTGSQLGVVFRFQQTSLTGYRVVHNYEGGAGKPWQLHFIRDGSATILASVAEDIGGGYSMNFNRDTRVVVTDLSPLTNIVVMLAGATVIDYTTSAGNNITDGYTGLAVAGSIAGHYLYDLEVIGSAIGAPYLNLSELSVNMTTEQFPRELDPEEDSVNLSSTFLETWETGTLASRWLHLNTTSGTWHTNLVNHAHTLNDEVQYYCCSSQLSTVYNPFSLTTFGSASEACLKITPTTVTAGSTATFGKPYYSGIISRYNIPNEHLAGNILYGRMRGKFACGSGYHGGKFDVWTLNPVLSYRGSPAGVNPQWPMEIDICENFSETDNGEGGISDIHVNFINHNNDSRYSGTGGNPQYHAGRRANFAPTSGVDGGWCNMPWIDCYNEFVYFDLIWSKYGFGLYYNGQMCVVSPNPRGTINPVISEGFHCPMHIIFGHCLGGDWPGNVSGNITSGMKIGRFEQFHFK